MRRDPAAPVLEEGWYLMTTSDLERELRRWRDPSANVPPSNATRLTIEEALSYKASGNVPDDRGRTLRLVLQVDDERDLQSLNAKRLLYEPDFHEAPTWRKKGSKPVNVVPLRSSEASRGTGQAWWDDPGVATLEGEWRRRGTVAGMKVPAEYRGFVFKTVIALRQAGKDITPDAVADSVARWMSQQEAQSLRTALRGANQG